MRYPRLIYPDRVFEPQDERSDDTELAKDLELKTLLDCMADGDALVRQVSRQLLLEMQTSRETIAYRNGVLSDCLAHPEMVRDLYSLAEEALGVGKRYPMGILSLSTAPSVLGNAVNLLGGLLPRMERLKGLAEEYGDHCASDGLGDFFAMILREFPKEHLDALRCHIDTLGTQAGFYISAGLGPGNVPTGHTLRLRMHRRRSRLERLLADFANRLLGRPPDSFTLHVHYRDEASNVALDEFKHRGLRSVANVLAQSGDALLGLFESLRRELSFYLGCMNLHRALSELDMPVAFPEPVGMRKPVLRARELYDPCLAITRGGEVVGNDLQADGKRLLVITGANQGGKTTFLRAIGLAGLMMQAGMFVAAKAFRASCSRRFHSHFRRREDPDMEAGKLEEELRRMNTIVENLEPESTVLLNESFAATNEREGSEIAEQVVTGLLEAGVRVVYVTHLHEFADGFYRLGCGDFLFLRAERRSDGRRTFRVVSGRPEETSFGRDLHDRIFSSPDGVN